MKSKLYPALVLAGISWGAAGSGCGESRRQSDPREPEGPEASGRGPTGGGVGIGGAGASVAGSGGTTGGAVPVAGAGSGGGSAVGGFPGAGGGGATGGDDPPGGEGGAADAASGAGGSGPGSSVAGGITDAGADAPTDAFCDTAWPTTKGNPAPPPTCEDQAACGGPPNDAGFQRWLQCRARLGDFQCDFTHVTSICQAGEWVCPPNGLLPIDCACYGATPAGKICSEDGFVPLDGGAAGAPG
jgi:hypothetical protein